MAEVEDDTHGCKGLKRPAGDTVNHSSTLKKSKPTILLDKGRVNIGSNFERWRALRIAKGMRTNEALAAYLLDDNGWPSTPTSSGAKDKNIKISQSEVQILIEQEVNRAVNKNNKKLKGLIETIQKLDHGVSYERSIQKLEARVNTVTKRAEEALAYMTKTEKKSPHPPQGDMEIIRIDSEDETTETDSQRDEKSVDCLKKSGGLHQMMENTKQALKKMHADKQYLRENPSVGTHLASPECEKEAKDEQEEKNNMKLEEPKAEAGNVESLSSGDNKIPRDKGSEQGRCLYPPLPSTIFPSVMNMEAASYNIPQRPEVHLALIRDPAGLSVLWKVHEEDPSAPPMDSYSIFMCTEKVKGSGNFPKWNMIGEVKAIALPMCVMIRKYKPGHKVCIAVVGKDKFGRCGPYSKVVTAAIPE